MALPPAAPSLLDSVAAILWEKGEGDAFTYVSAGAETLLGHAARRWVDEPGFWAGTVVHGDDLAAVRAAHAEAAASDAPRTLEYRAVTAAGTVRWLHETVTPAAEPATGRTVLRGVTLDVTERKQRELDLTLAKERQEALFDNLSELAWLKDADSRFLAVNETLARVTGTTRAAMIGKTDFDFFPPEIAARYQRGDREVVESGEPFRTEEPFVRGDGRTVWVETMKTPFRDQHGRYVGTIGVARDITLRKQAESEIAAAEAHYRRLVATSPYGMYALDAEGRLVDANQALATILERPAEELIGMSFLDVVAPEGRDLADPRVRRPREGRREVDEVESWVVRPSGERRRVIIRSIAVDEEGAVARSHGVVRDVTEERAMEAQLRRAERLASVGSLVGGVAHELNNPLAAIKGFAQLMMLDEHSPEDREALETMLREADRAASIVSHLRVLAQQTVDDVRAQTAVDLNDVVRHVLKVRRYTLETGNVRVVEELDPALPPVWANRDQMEQVAANLILNAEQAMAGQARPAVLTVRTLVGGSRVCLDVSDTGPGIPREHRERIFDPFWTTKPPGQGTGLGLSLVHGFVAETGGEVSVESEMGVGSRFRVSVPPLGTAGADPAAPAEAEAAPAARPVRALLVDDEEAIRRSLRRFLTRRGIEVQEAADGEEALRHIRDQPADRAFDVILSDLRMPGLSGDRLLETLRADGRGYDRRLIVMTGDSASSEAAGILAAVGVPVIFKPFDLLAIERAIRERVEGAR